MKREFTYRDGETFIEISDDESTPSPVQPPPVQEDHEMDDFINGGTSKPAPMEINAKHSTSAPLELSASIVDAFFESIDSRNVETSGSQSRRKSTRKGRRKYECYKCRYMMTRFHSLRRHMREHPAIIRCERCKEEFPYLSGLKTHQFKKFRCELWNSRGTDQK